MKEVSQPPARKVGWVTTFSRKAMLAPDAELAQAAVHDARRLLQREPPGAHLHEQRIVVRRDHRAGEGAARVEADARAARRAVGLERAGVGREAVLRVLGGHPALDGVAADLDRLLVGEADLGQRRALRDPDLGLHQVPAGDHLRHRVLHLNAWVHLDEVEAPGAVEQELAGARAPVADLPRDGERGLADLLPPRRAEAHRRRELDHLLVAPLDRAVPLVEVDQVAVRVAEDLHLDVLGVLDVSLEEHRGVPERRPGLAPRGAETLQQLGPAARHPHATPAAARRGLDDDGVAVLAGEDERLLLVLDGIVGARHHRHAGPDRRPAPRHLVSQAPLLLRGRADEDEPGRLHPLRELRVLGQEAVPGVDGVDVAPARQGDDLVDPQVGLDGPLPLPHQVGLVGLVAVEGEPVLLRVDRDRPDPELGGGAEDADGDLAAVGGHDLADATRREWGGHDSPREHDPGGPSRGPAGRRRCRRLVSGRRAPAARPPPGRAPPASLPPSSPSPSRGGPRRS
jgi:hypothetical protein